MKFHTLILALLGAACSPPQTHTIYIVDQDRWLWDATEAAMGFWAEEPRGVRFELSQKPSPNLTVLVEQTDNDDGQVAAYNAGRIRVDAKVSRQDETMRKCILAHEIGHYLRLTHQEKELGLMNSSVAAFDGDCLWSDADMEEFCETNHCENPQ